MATRFRLTELTDGRSFSTGQVAPVEDDDDPADAAAIDEALRLFGLLRELTESDVDAPDRGIPQLSFALAGKVELPADEKLALLGETSERQRMELVQELLANAVLTAQRVRRAAERASTNGRVDTSGEPSERQGYDGGVAVTTETKLDAHRLRADFAVFDELVNGRPSRSSTRPRRRRSRGRCSTRCATSTSTRTRTSIAASTDSPSARRPATRRRAARSRAS